LYTPQLWILLDPKVVFRSIWRYNIAINGYTWLTSMADPPFRPVPELSDDLLRGAFQIGAFLYPGDPLAHRKVYHNAERLGVFRLGRILYARRSELAERLSGKQREPQK
jgi:hypothetical protein